MSRRTDPYEKWAESYDAEGDRYQWHGPAVVFGLMYPHLEPGQTLLDLGVGTGLGSFPFHKAGLTITGLDSSPSMIQQCRRKGLPIELVHHDLTAVPWPFANDRFDHIISTCVFHFIDDLAGIAGEAARVIEPGGFFGFDFDEYDPAADDDYRLFKEGVYESYDAEYEQRLIKQSEGYITGVLQDAGFEIVHDTEFLATRENKRYFRTLVTRYLG